MELAVSPNHRPLAIDHKPEHKHIAKGEFPVEIPVRMLLNILKMSMLRTNLCPADRLSIEVPPKFVNRSSILPGWPGTRIFLTPFFIPTF